MKFVCNAVKVMRRKVMSSRRRDDLVHHTADFHSVNMAREKRVAQVEEGNDAGGWRDAGVRWS